MILLPLVFSHILLADLSALFSKSLKIRMPQGSVLRSFSFPFFPFPFLSFSVYVTSLWFSSTLKASHSTYFVVVPVDSQKITSLSTKSTRPTASAKSVLNWSLVSPLDYKTAPLLEFLGKWKLHSPNFRPNSLGVIHSSVHLSLTSNP